MSVAVAVSNSPVYHYHHHNHNSIFTSASTSPSSLSPRPCSISGTGLGSPSSGLGLAKRKRPTRLDIPIMGVGFASVGTPRIGVGKEVVEEEGSDGVYSVCCKKGRRSYLEDRFSVYVDDSDCVDKQAIFGVFDGHGGAKAAEYAAEKLNKNILTEIKNKGDQEDIEEAVKRAYLKTDSDFLEGELNGGSCCVTALITEGDLVVSNAGDCRAVISRSGVAEALTTDHRPSREDEKARIEAKGGYIDCYNNGVWRIQGSLAVSRGIGDRQLKQFVTAEPETRVVQLSPNDDFLILASDGLWDKVTNQEAVDAARPLCIGSDKSSAQPLSACKKLVDLAVSRGSLDDVSVMIIPLERYLM